MGLVTEFESSYDLGFTFKGYRKLSSLRTHGRGWNNVQSNDAVIFLDNHDKQRDDDDNNEHNDHVINYKSRRLYIMATAFYLAHPYGIPCLLSGFAFKSFDQGIF